MKWWTRMFLKWKRKRQLSCRRSWTGLSNDRRARFKIRICPMKSWKRSWSKPTRKSKKKRTLMKCKKKSTTQTGLRTLMKTNVINSSTKLSQPKQLLYFSATFCAWFSPCSWFLAILSLNFCSGLLLRKLKSLVPFTVMKVLVRLDHICNNFWSISSSANYHSQ